MARPVHADAEATRRRILESALDLFSARGTGHTSIRDIAAGAGVSVAMAHHYFGSKEALYGACIDTMYAELGELRAPVEQALRDGGSVAEVMERAVRSGFRFGRAHQKAARLLFRTIVESGELDRDRQERVQMPFLAEGAALLGAALGKPAAELRLGLQSVVSLVTRYAISSDRELSIFAGVQSPAAARAAVEDHLVAVARALLGASAESLSFGPPASPRRTHANAKRPGHRALPSS